MVSAIVCVSILSVTALGVVMIARAMIKLVGDDDEQD